jgi:hypothetical protein
MYTLILQNSVTKEIFSYNLVDNTPDSIYYEFNIELQDMIDGEYEYLLIENPARLPISSNYNNVFDSEMEDPVIIVNLEGKPLTAGAEILIADRGEVRRIDVLTFGLMRIGDYKSSKVTYNKQNKYVTYERK